MSINNQPLEQRLDSLVAPAEPGGDQQQLFNAPEQPVADTQQEPIQTAGLIRGGVDLLEGLTKKGARAAKEPKIVEDAVKVAPPPPTPPGASKPVATPVAPVQPAAVLKVTKPRPVDVTDMNKIAADRQAAIDAGTAQAKPPETPISSAWTDNDGLAATIQAAGDSFAQQAPSMSLRSIYMQAINAGVPEQFLKTALAGENMESTVGGSELAKRLAGAVVVHDESAKRLDDLFGQMAAGTLDEQGKLNLRLQLAQHKIIVDQIKGIQTDVARSLNVFKRVKDKGPGLNTQDIRSALDELGANQSDQVLFQLATDYLDTPTRAGKNRLIEAGFGAKLRDAWFHTYQANLLNDPQTHAYNLVGGMVFGSLQPLERMLAAGIGTIRTAIPGANPDRYQMEEILAGLAGLKNGMLDGWELAKEALKRGGESKMTDAGKPLNPVSSANFSDTPLRLFGQEVYRTPDLRDTWIGRAIDGIGFVQDAMSFKPIAAADEFVGGLAARYQLGEEAYRFANHEFDRLVAAGMDEGAAGLEVQGKVTQLLSERPRSMQESIEGMRRMVTLQEKIDKEGALGEFYWWSNQILNLAPVKIVVPFSKTISNLFIEGSSYIPLLNTVSPRFYDMWSKGGRHRDVAIARMSMGGTAIASTALLTLDNRFTGSGPSQREDRAALEKMGWQPYSAVFDKGEISEANIELLSKITKVAVGPDKIYVSYARFDPVSMVLAMGSDMGDAAKFDRHPDREDWQVMAMAGATAVGEYMSNLPLMQGVGELLSIARSRQEDAGDKLVLIMDGLAKQFANFLYTGTPGVGMSNSTLMAHIERMVDPTKSNTKSPEMDTPPGLRAYYEARQRLMSRIPGLSDQVPVMLDNLGREVKVQNRGQDYWLNWSPVLSATEGKMSEADAVLARYNYGIDSPSETWDGVKLSAEQINRYKRLYGQEITEDGMNLEQAIPYEVKRAEEDARIAGDAYLPGDAQGTIKMLVSKYRQAAKQQLLIEYPNLEAAMARNREISRTYGK